MFLTADNIARMIVPRTSRTDIMKKLRAKVARRLPVFIASAGSGLVAQLLEAPASTA